MVREAVPGRRQRIAAYALLVREGALLLSQLSARTAVEGRWTLPGGGIDHGEEPRAALRREVYEETGLYVEPARLLDVHSTHYTGPNWHGVVEDFHGVHLIFDVSVAAGSAGVAPHVTERDGSTRQAAWVPLAEVASLPTLSVVTHALTLHEQQDAPG